MAGESEDKGGAPLPPKLDLRKSGVVKPAPAVNVQSAPADDSSETMRIAVPESGGGPSVKAMGPVLAPKPTIMVQVPSSPVPAAPQPAATVPATQPGISIQSLASAIAQADDNSQTMRITVPESGGPTVRTQQAVAPRPAPQPPAAAAPVAESRRPALSPVTPAPAPQPQAAAQTPAAGVKPLAVMPKAETTEKRPSPKSETSRIPLEVATAVSNAPVGRPTTDLKTIRIKPAAATAGAKLAVPGIVQAPEQPAVTPPVDEKRKTSRISLEAALAYDEKTGDKAAGTTPKTIRLKRPGESTTVKATPQPDLAGEPRAGRQAMGQTARLDTETGEGEEEEGPTPTRRKTIKVKRPTDRPSVKGVTITRAAEGEETAGEEAETEAAFEESAGVFGIVALVAAILAIIVGFVVIYVLSAQAFGPNVSLTHLSSGAPGLNLGWPGKLSTPQ